MHVGNRNKQIATKNMWEVTGNAPRSVRLGQPRSTRNICPFSLFLVCTIFCLIFFFSSFFIADFSFFGAYFYCLSVSSLLYLLQILFFFVSLFSLFFSCSHFLYLHFSMFWEIPLCMLISHFFLYLSFRKTNVCLQEKHDIFFKTLPLLQSILTCFISCFVSLL